MKRKSWVLLAVLLAALAAAMPALAAVPNEGTVYEGESVPGIELGFSRAEVEASYGQPERCQAISLPSDNAYCAFRASNGALVSVRYRGADGGFASNSPEDVVTEIRWGEPFSDWTTTAGINTALAKTDPEAVIAAYPDAEVTGTPGVDGILVDWLLGIEVRWSYDGYTHTIHVGMRIFEPLASLPTVEQTHVQDIELLGYKDRGRRKIYAWAQILDEHQQAATYSAVYGEWVLPDGSTQPAYEDFVGLDGAAFFELTGKLQRGTYTFRVIDVQLADHSFDAAGSVLETRVYVK
ncbi:MAG: hypothetical protein P8X95_21970 [Anaerolineales bacterium]|jgi:hypothetical protein